jgi:hypothetical protein
MFWKIGDHVAKLQADFIKENKEVPLEFDEVWISILERLISFAQDDHSEMRQSAIHTFSNLMISHGNLFSQVLWNRIMHDMIFKMIDQALEAYITNMRNEKGASLETPKFNPDKKVNFDDGAKSPEEKAKIIKLWVDTLTILMQNLLKITKKYIAVIEKTPNLNSQSDEILILKNVLIKLKGIIMVSRNDLIAESIKVFHEIILAKPEILAHIVESIFDVLTIVKSFLVEVRQDSREIKIIINKFIPEVLDILMELYQPARHKILNPNRLPYSRHLFDIIEKALLYSK